VVILDGDELYRLVFGSMTLAQALLVAREERRLARPTFFRNSFILHYLILPDQPVAAGIENYIYGTRGRLVGGWNMTARLQLGTGASCQSSYPPRKRRKTSCPTGPTSLLSYALMA